MAPMAPPRVVEPVKMLPEPKPMTVESRPGSSVAGGHGCGGRAAKNAMVRRMASRYLVEPHIAGRRLALLVCLPRNPSPLPVLVAK